MQRQLVSRWFRENLSGKKGQRGFTLIELLVVVTILGVLAGIVTLSLVGLTTNASAQSCNTEYKTVQSALDGYMAYYNQTTLTAGDQTTFTNDMTGVGGATGGNVALYNSAPTAGSPNFTRNGTTAFYYKWDKYGKVTAIADSGGKAIANCTIK
jgi:prepilin-type N-terminal cleavage/methylation domain-containing protein